MLPMECRLRIFLADLGHNLVTVTSDTYPLGVGYLAAFAKAYAKSDEPLEIRIFRDPDELKQAIDTAAPDLLGLSSYSWNHHLALQFARYAKARAPGMLTLMGGPNFPLTTEEQDDWMRTMPEIDIHVRGPTYEGERAFLAVLQRFIDTGSIAGVMAEALPGNQWVVPATGEIVRGPEVPRIRDLDEIPSPYQTGLMDKFFPTGLFALLQLTRGCPFTCQFCNSSVNSNSKAFRHSLDRMRADLDYIVARIDHASPLCFADDNFGMYLQDVELADYLGQLMDRHDWPKYIRTTTGKNKGERIIEVMKRAKGRLPMTAAVQSLSPIVLKNIQRDNIKLETYAQIQAELHAKGMQSYGELILCMPGETKQSFMDAVDQLIETGVSRVAAHQLMLLHGAPLANPDQRQKFGFKTLYRVVARCLGDYGIGGTVVETEEMVVQSESFSFQDYLDTRVFHLLLTIYYYEDNFAYLFRFGREMGLRPYQIVVHAQKRLQEAPKAFRDAVADYLAENQAELFESREECVAWAEENYDRLISGELGGNLLSKYSMIGRFFVLKEALAFLHDTISDMIGPEAEAQDMLASLTGYYTAVMLDSPFARALNATPDWVTSYDVETWAAADFARPLASYRFAEPQVFATTIDPRARAILTQRLQTFGEHPAGLGRFTRSLFAGDMRRRVVDAREKIWQVG